MASPEAAATLRELQQERDNGVRRRLPSNPAPASLRHACFLSLRSEIFLWRSRVSTSRVWWGPRENLPCRPVALLAPIPRTLPPDETSALPASRYAPTAKRKIRSGHLCLTAFSCASSARASTAASACTSASSGARLLSIRARPSPVATSYQKNAGPSKIVVHCAPLHAHLLWGSSLRLVSSRVWYSE